MQLNEIIEENSLPTISQKTRISVGNLEAIVNRDWGQLKKVQALGFLSILEREYGIDLSDLRAECRAYFESQPATEEAPPLVVAPVESPMRPGTRLVLVLVALLAAGGGWMAFVSTDRNSSEPTVSAVPASESGSSFYDSVLSMAKGWFGSDEAAPAPDEVPALNEAWAGDNATAEGTAGELNATAPSEANESEKATKAEEKEGNGSGEGEEARIIRQVKQEQAKAEELRQQAAQEGNGTETRGEDLEALSRMILAPAAAEPAAENRVENEPAADATALESQVPSLQEPAPQKEEQATAEAPAQEAAAEPAPATEEAKQPAAAAGPVIFRPRAKIWVGYTNLRTMKRTAKVTTQEIPFDTAEGDYILATGHGLIDFKTAAGEKKLNDGKRHFFMIAKGDVREISHEEFQRLNKSKVW